MQNKTEIGEAFRNKLTNLEKMPSDDLWSIIESDLNKKRKKRILFWLIPILMSVGIFSVLLISNQFQSDKNRKSQQSQINTEDTNTQNTISKSDSLKNNSVKKKNKQPNL